MSDEGEGTGGIAGLSVGEAVDVVVAADASRDPEAVRRALETVAADGVVTREGVDDALAHLSKVVTTAETRAELAGMALSDAREAAEPVADLGAVRSRLAAFAADLAAVEERAEALGEELGALLDRGDDADVYEVAAGVRDLAADANDVQRTADELQVDVEEFERWLADPDVRFEELEADLEALEASVDDLGETVDRVADAVDGLDADDARTVGSGEDGTDPGVAWADAVLRHRALGLLLADVRAELADLRTWATREDLDAAGRAEGIEDRVEALAGRVDRIGERLDRLARPRWRERFDDRVSALETALETAEPPVDWARVRADLETHRGALAEEQ